MKPDVKACGQALITAFINVFLALTLMHLIEFAISGSFQVVEAYVWAVSVIGLVIFFAQFWRQRHLCRHCDSGSNTDEHAAGKNLQT